MNTHGIVIPDFTEFTKHDVVDSVALTLSQAFRQHSKSKGQALDIDRFIDWLDISTEWDCFDDENSVSCFARIDLSTDDLIQINQNYQDLFESRPDVYRVCVGHEAGHIVLRHVSNFANSNNPSLFEDISKDQPNFLHKNSWAQYGLSSGEVRKRQLALTAAQEKLVKNAIVSPKANQALREMENKFEPEWMFWQAEHFARCIAIPSDKLFAILENQPLYSGWRAIGELAGFFQVPLGTMKTRLTKLKLVEMDVDGTPTPILGNRDTQRLL